MADAGLQIKRPSVLLGIWKLSVRNESQRQVGIFLHWNSSRWARGGKGVRDAAGIWQKAGMWACMIRCFTWVKPTVAGSLPYSVSWGWSDSNLSRGTWCFLGFPSGTGIAISSIISLVSGLVASVAFASLLPTTLETLGLAFMWHGCGKKSWEVWVEGTSSRIDMPPMLVVLAEVVQGADPKAQGAR